MRLNIINVANGIKLVANGTVHKKGPLVWSGPCLILPDQLRNDVMLLQLFDRSVDGFYRCIVGYFGTLSFDTF